jgi:uncharacterized protein (TIGR00304 family)
VKLVSDQLLSSVGLTLVFAGLALILVAVVWLFARSSRGKGSVKGGGVVVIGPVPIIFGTDKESVKIILVLSIILVALLLVLMIFSYRIFP